MARKQATCQNAKRTNERTNEHQQGKKMVVTAKEIESHLLGGARLCTRFGLWFTERKWFDGIDRRSPRCFGQLYWPGTWRSSVRGKRIGLSRYRDKESRLRLWVPSVQVNRNSTKFLRITISMSGFDKPLDTIFLLFSFLSYFPRRCLRCLFTANDIFA